MGNRIINGLLILLLLSISLFFSFCACNMEEGTKEVTMTHARVSIPNDLKVTTLGKCNFSHLAFVIVPYANPLLRLFCATTN